MQDLRPLLEQALVGRYRLERELGRGGMGVATPRRVTEADIWLATLP